MGHAIAYCDTCGERADRKVDGRNFCAAHAPAVPAEPVAPPPTTRRAIAPTTRRAAGFATPRKRSLALPALIALVVLLAIVAAVIVSPAKDARPTATVAPAPAPAPVRPAPAPPPPAKAEGRVEEPSPKPVDPPPPVAPPPPAPSKPWYEIADEAYEHYRSRDYARAKELYLQAMPLLPERAPEGKHEAWWYYAPYNLAAIFALESASLTGAARLEAHAQCRRWLAKAIDAGYAKRKCRCHRSTLEHFRRDDKFDAVRGESWFAEIEESAAKP